MNLNILKKRIIGLGKTAKLCMPIYNHTVIIREDFENMFPT